MTDASCNSLITGTTDFYNQEYRLDTQIISQQLYS